MNTTRRDIISSLLCTGVLVIVHIESEQIIVLDHGSTFFAPHLVRSGDLMRGAECTFERRGNRLFVLQSSLLIGCVKRGDSAAASTAGGARVHGLWRNASGRLQISLALGPSFCMKL